MKKTLNFTLLNQRGEKVTLFEELKKHQVLLYFYPKDMTPGCTMEGIGFSKLMREFEKNNTKIFGVSADSVEKHEKFCQKESLSIDLLSDPEHEICKQFEVWKEKKNFGKTYMGISRESFLIGQDATILKHWKTVKPVTHPQQVLDFISSN